ncbi:MAG TPA: DUF11 domain-containing protein, partial [Thermoflexia bacterium]|nr:DUF11 domain-containing protein [Thermoflexia bacterium]
MNRQRMVMIMYDKKQRHYLKLLMPLAFAVILLSVSTKINGAQLRQSSCTAALENGGFEYGTNSAPWVEVSTYELIYHNPGQAHGGNYHAWLGGVYNEHLQEELYQPLTLPATLDTVTLSYWWFMETEKHNLADYLTVSIRDSSNNTIVTVEQITNQSTADSWQESTFAWPNASDYAGQVIHIHFESDLASHPTRTTSFFIDDVSLSICNSQQTDLSLSKTAHPDPVLAGQTLTYTLTYSNAGSMAAPAVSITDTLPLSVTYGGLLNQPAGWNGPTRTGRLLAWYTPTLAPGAAGELVFTVTVNELFSGPLTNNAIITDSNASDSDPTNNQTSVTTTVKPRRCWVRLNNSSQDYFTVQAAVDASAAATDIVKVAGYCSATQTYGGHTQVVYLNKTLTVQGGYTRTNWTTPDPSAHPTTLDAAQQGRVFYIEGGSAPTITGLQITGGTTPGGNTDGGGIYLRNADLTLTHNTIFSNTSTDDAGGIYLYTGHFILEDNEISSNTAADSGAGLYLRNCSPAATLRNNRITANHAAGDHGGGLRVRRCDATLINTLIADNSVPLGGSGFYISEGNPVVRMWHTTVARNTGAGEGIYVDSGTTWLTNTLIVSQTTGIHVGGGDTAHLEATLWGSGAWANGADTAGSGTIDTAHDYYGDPAFVVPESGDYHLTASSAAVDMGVATNVTADIDGEARPQGLAPDLGWDEVLPDTTVKLETGTVSDVGANWVTVHLANSYTAPVVIGTLNNDQGALPLVTRVRHAAGSSFELRLQQPGGGTVSTRDVHYLVMESGAYTLPNGIHLEGQIYTSTVTDGSSSWHGEPQSYLHDYHGTTPVVLGQVLSYNDADWSVFWDRGSSRSQPPDANHLWTGKHVSKENPIIPRADEQIGFIVIEQSNSNNAGALYGLEYEAWLGADSVAGVDTAPPYPYTFQQTFTTTPEVALISKAAEDGGDGGWAILYGNNPLTADTIDLAIDESLASGNRTHTQEQVSYLVFQRRLIIAPEPYL